MVQVVAVAVVLDVYLIFQFLVVHLIQLQLEPVVALELIQVQIQ